MYLLKALLIIQLLLGTSCREQPENDLASSGIDHAGSKKELLEFDRENGFAHDIQLTEIELRIEKELSSLRANFLKVNGGQAFFNKPFQKVIQTVEESRLFRLIQNMPKGGLLHCHSGGITDISWLITQARNLPECFVFTLKGHTDFVYGQLAIFNQGEQPKGFIQLDEKFETDKNFENELFGLLTLQEPAQNTDIDIWEEFEKRFLRISRLVAYRPFFKAYYERAFLDLIEDNIYHVEIRFILEELYDLDTSYPIEITLKDLEEVTTNIQKEFPEFSLSIIYTSFKFFDVNTIDEQLKTAYDLKKKYPDLISGFDLVAEEARGNSISYFDKSWAKMEAFTEQYGFELPLLLHAGESRSTGNENLYDAILLNTKRIGHGLNLSYYPSLTKKVVQENILVELSPLSNKILGYVPDLGNHPARVLMSRGVQCSISSDDPSVFGYKGLSYDFFMAYIAWELNLKEIKKLVFNSIEHANLTNNRKKSAMQNLTEAWDEFVSEFAIELEDKDF